MPCQGHSDHRSERRLTMSPLATLKDLDNNGIDHADNDALAERLLESVSAQLRDAAGSPISLGEYTFTIPSEQSRKLDLPCRPVRNVSKVLVDGEETTGWRLFGSAIYRDEPWGPYGGIPVPVTITATIGCDPIPADIIRLACAYVAAGLRQHKDGGPGNRRGVAYERIDDYQIGFIQSGDAVDAIDDMELPEMTRKRLRSRFGSSAVSIGVFR